MTQTTPRGAARERTSLAWRRTALALAVNGVLLVRSSDVRVQVAAFAVIAAATGVAAASAMAFRDTGTHGWFAGARRRAKLFALLAAAVAVLDVAAIVT